MNFGGNFFALRRHSTPLHDKSLAVRGSQHRSVSISSYGLQDPGADIRKSLIDGQDVIRPSPGATCYHFADRAMESHGSIWKTQIRFLPIQSDLWARQV